MGLPGFWLVWVGYPWGAGALALTAGELEAGSWGCAPACVCAGSGPGVVALDTSAG